MNEGFVMIAPSPSDGTIGNRQEYEGPVKALLAKELRRIAPQLRLHGISVVFDRNREKRLITLTKPNRPKNLPSRLSNNLIGHCVADTFEEQNPL